MKKAKKTEFIPSKWLYIIFFTFPLVFVFLNVRALDNDIWYLLSEGREIIQNGLYHIDPLSMHAGLKVVVQNWLSAASFWVIYDWFGEMGLYFIILLSNFFICLLLYKICMILSDKNRILSLLVMFATDVTLCSHFIVSRPQILSFIILLALIYVLELYISTDKGKYLIWIPILSLVEVNLHASLWWMLFLFMLPYVIDSFKIPFAKTQGYRKKPLFIAIAVALAVGLINPYGYKAITFIFTSYGDKYMHVFINELLPFSFNNTLSKHMFVIMLIVGLIYTFFRDGNVRIRYICLFCGTLILGFMSVKGFSHFILVSLFPLAYFFKDIFPNTFDDLDLSFRRILKFFFMTIALFSMAGLVFLYVRTIPKIKLNHNADRAIEVLDIKFPDKGLTVYSSFNDGGFVEFNGYKPYIDPRAELYLKVNNKKADIFKEFYELQHGLIQYKDFLKKYNFDAMLVANNDYLFNLIDIDNDGYFVLYEDAELGYRLYLRNDLYDEKERIEVVNNYKVALKKAQDEANKSK